MTTSCTWCSAVFPDNKFGPFAVIRFFNVRIPESETKLSPCGETQHPMANRNLSISNTDYRRWQMQCPNCEDIILYSVRGFNVYQLSSLSRNVNIPIEQPYWKESKCRAKRPDLPPSCSPSLTTTSRWVDHSLFSENPSEPKSQLRSLLERNRQLQILGI